MWTTPTTDILHRDPHEPPAPRTHTHTHSPIAGQSFAKIGPSSGDVTSSSAGSWPDRAEEDSDEVSTVPNLVEIRAKLDRHGTMIAECDPISVRPAQVWSSQGRCGLENWAQFEAVQHFSALGQFGAKSVEVALSAVGSGPMSARVGPILFEDNPSLVETGRNKLGSNLADVAPKWPCIRAVKTRRFRLNSAWIRWILARILRAIGIYALGRASPPARATCGWLARLMHCLRGALAVRALAAQLPDYVDEAVVIASGAGCCIPPGIHRTTRSAQERPEPRRPTCPMMASRSRSRLVPGASRRRRLRRMLPARLRNVGVRRPPLAILVRTPSQRAAATNVTGQRRVDEPLPTRP